MTGRTGQIARAARSSAFYTDAVPDTTLTARERAVLAAIERRLGNQEIARELFISVRTVESHIASLRRKLGADSRDDLIAAAQSVRGTVLRLPENPFVGRAAAMRALEDAVRTHHWVTVTGPGGVGKTRLALEYARVSPCVPVVVELEHSGAADVVARIARSLDWNRPPGSTPSTRSPPH